mmetsp:Transcript_2479/g.6245  ORF Transcript_2479/g.6245 Transcript_2479/m.6245 type:complete len:271 (-) Transcript_2479:374-1186(-)
MVHSGNWGQPRSHDIAGVGFALCGWLVPSRSCCRLGTLVAAAAAAAATAAAAAAAAVAAEAAAATALAGTGSPHWHPYSWEPPLWLRREMWQLPQLHLSPLGRSLMCLQQRVQVDLEKVKLQQLKVLADLQEAALARVLKTTASRTHQHSGCFQRIPTMKIPKNTFVKDVSTWPATSLTSWRRGGSLGSAAPWHSSTASTGSRPAPTTRWTWSWRLWPPGTQNPALILLTAMTRMQSSSVASRRHWLNGTPAETLSRLWSLYAANSPASP